MLGQSPERAVTIRAADCISTPSACDHAERLGPSAWAAVLLYTLHCYPTHQLLRRRPNHGLRCIVYPPCREERYNPCHYEFKPVLMPVLRTVRTLFRSPVRHLAPRGTEICDLCLTFYLTWSFQDGKTQQTQSFLVFSGNL
ncbi:unnamed protein product [Symbiodinium sp. CCMP2592]|nr:unnamed protein product [Symbiodinium sp. CCMP2592]